MTPLCTRVTVAVLAATAAYVPALGAQQRSGRPGYHAVVVPLSVGPGDLRETKVLLETPHLKLARVVLRQGAILEEHSSPMPVTIQVITGSGVVAMEGATEVVSPGVVLALAPGMRHTVRPEAGSDMILLVHHLKTSRSGPRPPKGPS